MTERTNAYAEDETLTTRAGDTNTAAPGFTKLTLTHTPGDNERWWYFASAVYGLNQTTTDIIIRFRNDTAGADYGSVNSEPQDNTNKLCFTWGKEVTYGVAPGSQDLKLQHWDEVSGATNTVEYAHIWGVKCEAEDKSAASDGTTSTQSAAFTTKVTLTETLTGNYLFLCFCEFGGSNAVPMTIRADHGGTKYGSMTVSTTDNATWRTWATAFVKEGLSGSQTVTIEFNNTTPFAFNVSLRNARIFAICLDNFANYDFVENRTRDTNATATPEDQSSLTFTPLASRNHIAFGAMIGDEDNTGTNGFLEFERDGTAIAQMEEEPNIGAEAFALLAFRRESLSGSPVFKTQKWSEAAGTVGASESAIVIIDLDGPIVASDFVPRAALY